MLEEAEVQLPVVPLIPEFATTAKLAPDPVKPDEVKFTV